MIGTVPIPFIFIHIPKCAGTSIEKAFIPIISDRRGFEDLPDDERTKLWLPGVMGLQHSKLYQYAEHFKLEEHFKFAFVRNPWDRAISQIEYLRLRSGTSIFPNNNLRENLKIYCASKKTIESQDLSASQIDYLRTCSGKVSVDFLGRFESLADDFQKVCRLLGMEITPELPHIFNSQRSRHYSAFYDAESTEWIRARFAEDIEFFGYEFDDSEK